MHQLRHTLKEAGWLDAEFRHAVRDRAEAFMKVLQCKLEELGSQRNEYGSSLKAAQEIDNLRSQYQDAVKYCHFAAYFCLREDKRESFLQSPNAFFSNSKTVLLSQQYKEHWLPRLVGIFEHGRKHAYPSMLSIIG